MCNTGIRSSELYSPHSCKELNETTIAESNTDDQIWPRDASSADIDQRQDEGGEGEGRETERSWVGELATFDTLV